MCACAVGPWTASLAHAQLAAPPARYRRGVVALSVVSMDGTSGELNVSVSSIHTGRSHTAQNGTNRNEPTTLSPAEETERWLLVRKSLLQSSPKLAKPLEEISENEWIKSRVTSLKRLLESCGNFHGGPKGEMWTALASAVSQHLGPRHEFLELISDHQDSLWTTCSLMTVTTLDSETSLDGKVGELEESEMSLSVPNVPLKVYGSIDLIEPTGKGRQ